MKNTNTIQKWHKKHNIKKKRVRERKTGRESKRKKKLKMLHELINYNTTKRKTYNKKK